MKYLHTIIHLKKIILCMNPLDFLVHIAYQFIKSWFDIYAFNHLLLHAFPYWFFHDSCRNKSCANHFSSLLRSHQVFLSLFTAMWKIQYAYFTVVPVEYIVFYPTFMYTSIQKQFCDVFIISENLVCMQMLIYFIICMEW